MIFITYLEPVKVLSLTNKRKCFAVRNLAFVTPDMSAESELISRCVFSGVILSLDFFKILLRKLQSIAGGFRSSEGETAGG